MFELIVSPENIALAAYKAFKGKSMSREVQIFRSDFLNNIYNIREEMLSGEIVIGNYNSFVIYEPKERLICAAPLKQRIVHHAIMNICHDKFDKHLMFDCYASRAGKGTHKAINRVKRYISSYKYFAKLDFRKYFDSIDHDILKGLLRRLFKDSSLICLLDRIIDSYGGNKGLPIGNLTSQYFANYYISGLDHFMKEVVRAPVYIRYMDDVIIMSNNRGQLKCFVSDYNTYANEKLKLEIKPPIIGRCCCGVPFLGYRIFANRILMNGKGKRRFLKKLRILNTLYQKAAISENEYAARIISFLSYACFADSYNFRIKVSYNGYTS